MPEEFVKQHIVPKRYLDRFTFLKNGKPVVGVRLNTDSEPKYFTSPTDKVGYVKNIYDVTDKDDPKYWEHYLCDEFDTLCGRPLENIISKITLTPKGKRVLNDADKDIIGKIITSQLVRTPENIEYSYSIYPDIEKRAKESFVNMFPKSEQGKI